MQYAVPHGAAKIVLGRYFVDMYYCVVPHYVGHDRNVMEVIEKALAQKGLALGSATWSSNALDCTQAARILELMPYAPVPALRSGETRRLMSKLIVPSDVRSAASAVKRLLDPGVTHAGTGHLPQFFAGRDTRTIEGKLLSLCNVMMVPLSSEERKALRTFAPKELEAAAA